MPQPATEPQHGLRWNRCRQHGAIHVGFPNENALIAGRGRFPHQSWPLDQGAFSLKSVIQGKEQYDLNGRRYELRPGRFLLVPFGLVFSSVPASRETEACPLYFSARTVEETAACVGGLAEEALLEHATQPVEVAPALLPFDERIERALSRIWELLQASTQTWPGAVEQRFDPAFSVELENAFHRALALAMDSRKVLARRLRRISAVKTSTREELYRRLLRAEDRMRAEFHLPLTLSDLAKTSFMSTYHFSQRFSEFYGEPPHKFLMRVRLAQARKLLKDESLPLKEVAQRCGYRSLPSFVNRFKREWGLTPGSMARGAV